MVEFIEKGGGIMGVYKVTLTNRAEITVENVEEIIVNEDTYFLNKSATFDTPREVLFTAPLDKVHFIEKV